MKLSQLNEYVFLDKNRDEVKIGDSVLFKTDGLGGSDGWTKGIVKSIDGKVIEVTNLEVKAGGPSTLFVKKWINIDKV